MRYRAYLIERYQGILGYAGGILLVTGISFMLPLLLLLFYPDESPLAIDFLLPGVLLFALGGVLWHRYSRQKVISLSMQESTVVVVIVWLLACLLGGIPFMLIGDLNFTQAVFESTSGWTTTGLSVIDVEETPRLVLFYRSIMQMAGGAGFAIIALAAITGPAGAGLSAAEGRTDQLAPHVRQSAGIVLRIYLIYIGFGILALRIAGMDWFDSVNHAFTAIATGGFSTRAESIAYWDSAAIELVLVLLMLLGSINFLTAYTITRRKFRPVLRNGEIRFMSVLLLVSVVSVFLFVTLDLYDGVGKALRVALFEVTTAISTAGLTTVNTLYADWASFGWLVLIVLMAVGGGSGSTAAGIKHYRMYVLLKAMVWEIRRVFMPAHTVNEPAIWHGEQRTLLSDSRVRRVALFVFLYGLVFIVGTSLVALHGYGLQESMFEFASALSGVGISSGVTAPDAPPLLLWTIIVGMFLGRLEMFAVIIGISKLVYDLRILSQKPENEA